MDFCINYMEFLTGSKQEFLNFLNSIDKEDNVAILTHIDLDGITSGIFLEDILKNREIKLKYLDFLFYGNGLFNKIINKLKKQNISKVFIRRFKLVKIIMICSRMV